MDLYKDTLELRKLSGVRPRVRPRVEQVMLACAHLLATLTEDPSTGHGCFLLDKDNYIISGGFNGCLPGITPPDPTVLGRRPQKYPWIRHAERNGISKVDVRSRMKGGTLIITGQPCPECAYEAIDAGFARIIYGNTFSNMLCGSPDMGYRWEVCKYLATQKGVVMKHYDGNGFSIQASFETDSGTPREIHERYETPAPHEPGKVQGGTQEAPSSVGTEDEPEPDRVQTIFETASQEFPSQIDPSQSTT